MKAPPSEDSKRKTFAANLLLEGHRCLVVGGGKIATRKLKILLDAGALPEVVAPELAPAMKELCEKSGAVVRLREFEDSDLDGAFLVFAATGSAELNARVAALCAKGGRLCCAIDAHWTEGSFITPASFELEGVKIAVSTGGASCRRSKAIKESLALQLKVMEGAEPFVLGVDHSTLPLEARAKFQLDAKAQDRLAFLFGGVRGMREFMILNTCNRLETIGVAFLREPGAEMMKLALGFDALPEGSVYLKRGHDAFAHLAALAAGLRSQSIGEKHIVSQLKDALKLARRKGWGSAFIQELLDYALHISKDIRAELGSLLEGGEIEDFAIELARRKAQEGTKALVLGTGALGKAVAAKLVAKGFQTAALYHSKKPDSPACPCEKIDALPSLLPEAGLVFAACSSEEPVIGAALGKSIRRGALLFDLASPRNIDKKLDASGDFEVVDLDGLKALQDKDPARIAKIMDEAAKTIDAHRELYEKAIGRFKGGD